jgi:hypothetical protein
MWDISRLDFNDRYPVNGSVASIFFPLKRSAISPPTDFTRESIGKPQPIIRYMPRAGPVILMLAPMAAAIEDLTSVSLTGIIVYKITFLSEPPQLADIKRVNIYMVKK